MDELIALNDFINKVQPLLQTNGFKLIEHQDKTDFIRVTEHGYNEIQMLPASYAGHSEFGLAFYIRVNEINSITNLYNTVVESAHGSNPTFGIGLGYFGIPNGDLIVDTKQQLESVVARLTKVVEDKVLPFFKKFDSVKAFDVEFNRDNRPQNLFLHDAFDRPIVGITAAALSGNPMFPYWEQYYRDRLKNASPHRKEKYEALGKKPKERAGDIKRMEYMKEKGRKL